MPASPDERYFSGFDLGQAVDFSAFVVARRLPRAGYSEVLDKYLTALAEWQAAKAAGQAGPKPARPRKWQYEIPYLRVWDLGTSYRAIASDAAEMYARKPLPGSWLAVDYTGVGRPVAEQLRAVGVDAVLKLVTITAGNAAKTDDKTGELHVPKRELVSNTVALMQSELVKVSPAVKHADRLKKELGLFTAKVSRRSNAEQFGTWADGQHDDLVLAMMLALWLGEREGAGSAKDIVTAPPESSAVITAPPGVFA